MEHVEEAEQAEPAVAPTASGGAVAPLLAWGRELAAPSQTALTYAQDPSATARDATARGLEKRRHDHPPQPYFVHKLVFQCERLGGQARTSDETDDVAVFAPDALPPLSLDRVTSAQIRRLSALAALPDAPTNFD